MNGLVVVSRRQSFGRYADASDYKSFNVFVKKLKFFLIFITNVAIQLHIFLPFSTSYRKTWELKPAILSLTFFNLQSWNCRLWYRDCRQTVKMNKKFIVTWKVHRSITHSKLINPFISNYDFLKRRMEELLTSSFVSFEFFVISLKEYVGFLRQVNVKIFLSNKKRCFASFFFSFNQKSKVFSSITILPISMHRYVY